MEKGSRNWILVNTFGQFSSQVRCGWPKYALSIDRGTSRGSVWLSWQTPLHRRYSALKPIKYQTPLQVS